MLRWNRSLLLALHGHADGDGFSILFLRSGFLIQATHHHGRRIRLDRQLGIDALRRQRDRNTCHIAVRKRNQGSFCLLGFSFRGVRGYNIVRPGRDVLAEGKYTGFACFSLINHLAALHQLHGSAFNCLSGVILDCAADREIDLLPLGVERYGFRGEFRVKVPFCRTGLVCVPTQERIVRAGRRLGRGDDGLIGQAGQLRYGTAALTVKRHRDCLALRDGEGARLTVGLLFRGLDAHLERSPARKAFQRPVRADRPGLTAVGAVLHGGGQAGNTAVLLAHEGFVLWRQASRRGGPVRRSKRRPAGGGVVVVLHLPDIERLAQIVRDAAAAGNRRAVFFGGADLVALLYGDRLLGIVQRIALLLAGGRGAGIFGDRTSNLGGVRFQDVIALRFAAQGDVAGSDLCCALHIRAVIGVAGGGGGHIIAGHNPRQGDGQASGSVCGAVISFGGDSLDGWGQHFSINSEGRRAVSAGIIAIGLRCDGHGDGSGVGMVASPAVAVGITDVILVRGNGGFSLFHGDGRDLGGAVVSKAGGVQHDRSGCQREFGDFKHHLAAQFQCIVLPGAEVAQRDFMLARRTGFSALIGQCAGQLVVPNQVGRNRVFQHRVRRAVLLALPAVRGDGDGQGADGQIPRHIGNLIVLGCVLAVTGNLRAGHSDTPRIGSRVSGAGGRGYLNRGQFVAV